MCTVCRSLFWTEPDDSGRVSLMTLQLQSNNSRPLPVFSRSLTRSRSARDTAAAGACPCRNSLSIEKQFALDPTQDRLYVVEKKRNVAKVWSSTLDGCRCELLLDTSASSAAAAATAVNPLPPESMTVDVDTILWLKNGVLYELSKRPSPAADGLRVRANSSLNDVKVIAAYGKHLQPMPGKQSWKQSFLCGIS